MVEGALGHAEVVGQVINGQQFGAHCGWFSWSYTSVVINDSINALNKREVIVPGDPWNDAAEVTSATSQGLSGIVGKDCTPRVVTFHPWISRKPADKAASRSPRRQHERDDQVSTEAGAVQTVSDA
jgi:hypothetical protein